MRVLVAAALVGATLGLAAPAQAQQAEDACAGFKWPIARERQAFGAPDLKTVASGAAFPGLGQGAVVTLGPEGDIAYQVKPSRPPKANPSYGADLGFDAGAGGPVQVTLSEDAWVDLVQNGKVLRSTAFSGKAGCQGVRKSVRFTLGPGPVSIEISNAASPSLKLAVMPGS